MGGYVTLPLWKNTSLGDISMVIVSTLALLLSYQSAGYCDKAQDWHQLISQISLLVKCHNTGSDCNPQTTDGTLQTHGLGGLMSE